MNQDQMKRARSIFDQAISLARSRQDEFVRNACQDDQSLLQMVRAMLELEPQPNSMLDGRILNPSGRQPPPHQSMQSKTEIGPDSTYIDGYRVISELGRGGMGVVYLAVDESLDRHVAIKVMLNPTSSNLLQRFVDEGRAMGRLNQENIVRVYARGNYNGSPYLVTEYLAGEGLRERIRYAPLPLAEVSAITSQICAGLSHAHENGIFHRDIKPENILLTHGPDGSRVAKLLDFGIAILRESNLMTGPAQIVGTCAYISPEQARGEPREKIDRRADIYSLGIVVYEMLTGVRPFNSPLIEVLLRQHISESPVPPSKVRPDANIPPEVDRVVLRALEKQPEHRYATAGQFATALAAAITPHSLPTKVQPTPPPRRRAPALLTAAATAIAAIASWAALRPSPSLPPTAPPAASPTPTLSVEVEQKQIGIVDPHKAFQAGDKIRLIASADRDGRFYVIHAGTSGSTTLLYPNPALPDSYKAVSSGQRITIPAPTAWLNFDTTSGNEKVYLVFAARPGEKPLQTIEKAVNEPTSSLPAGEIEATLSALQSIADGTTRSPNVSSRVITLRHTRD